MRTRHQRPGRDSSQRDAGEQDGAVPASSPTGNTPSARRGSRCSLGRCGHTSSLSIAGYDRPLSSSIARKPSSCAAAGRTPSRTTTTNVTRIIGNLLGLPAPDQGTDTIRALIHANGSPRCRRLVSSPTAARSATPRTQQRLAELRGGAEPRTMGRCSVSIAVRSWRCHVSAAPVRGGASRSLSPVQLRPVRPQRR